MVSEVTDADVDGLLDILRIYVPSAPLAQMLGDLVRSKAAGHDGTTVLASVFGRCRNRLDARGPLTFADGGTPLPPKGEPWRHPKGRKEGA